MKFSGHTYIIAEIGNTHEGSVGLAKQFIRRAASCGVDAVKLQTHIFDAESLPNAPNPPYFKDETRREYFERTAFALEQWCSLKAYAEDECGVTFLSSPFSLEAVDLLEEVGITIYKVPSGEVTNLPLLIRLAQTGKRVLLSSGMSRWDELDVAVRVLQEHGCSDLVVLQCVSDYPCPPKESGLNVLGELVERYHLPVGYSDHTQGVAIAVAAVTLGSTVIEKHFTLSCDMYGSDAAHSMEPEAFRQYVDEIRAVDAALSHPVDKDRKAAALTQMKQTFEKSIVAAGDLPVGRVLEFDDVAFKKPGDGISAAEFRGIMGRKLKQSVEKDHVFSWSDLE